MSSNELQANTCSNGDVLIYSKNLFPLPFTTSAQFHKHVDVPITDKQEVIRRHAHRFVLISYVRTFH